MIHIDATGLLSIAGGKWTTYRNMAEDCVNQAATLAQLDDRPCLTRTLRIHGATSSRTTASDLAIYGSDAASIQQIATGDQGLLAPLHSALPYTAAEVIWSTRYEMARTIEDVLARRTRALFLNARAAMEMAPRIAQIMATELVRDESWQRSQVQNFQTVAAGFLVESGHNTD